MLGIFFVCIFHPEVIHCLGKFNWSCFCGDIGLVFFWMGSIQMRQDFYQVLVG